MKKFNIWGSFTVDVDFDIEANSASDAENQAKQRIIDQFKLNAIGGIQCRTSPSFELYVDEED